MLPFLHGGKAQDMGKGGQRFALPPKNVDPVPQVRTKAFHHHAPFRHFGIQKGLPHSTVKALLVDRKGYLWIGTAGGGIARFDGKQMKHYDEGDGMIGKQVLDLFQDKAGNIWIGSIAGLTRFDGHKFTNFLAPGKCKDKEVEHCKELLMGGVIYDISQDEDGNMWFASAGGGVMKYDGNSFTYFIGGGECPKKPKGPCKKGLPGLVARTVTEGPQGRIWMGTFKKGMVTYEKGEGFSFYGNKASCKTFKGRYEDRTPLPVSSNVFWSSLVDSQNRLWIGTSQGLLKKGEGSWTFFRSKCENKKLQNCRKVGIQNDLVLDLEETAKGGLWLGTYGGAYRMVDDTVRTTLRARTGLSEQMVYDIAEGRHRSTWFGTAGGLDQSLSNSIEIYGKRSGLTFEKVNALYKDDRGRIWIGEAKGSGALQRWNGGDSIRTIFPKSKLGQGEITDLEGGTNGSLWFATNGGGFIRYGNDSFERYAYKRGKYGIFETNNILALHREKKGRLWVGGEGVAYRFGKDTVLELTYESGELTHPDINIIKADGQGRIWLGTPLGGINIYNKGGIIHLKKKNSGLLSDQIEDIAFGPKGTAWIATYGDGLNYLRDPEAVGEKKQLDWGYVKKEHGLPSNAVTGLYFDEQERLWVATDKGAARIDPDSGKVLRTWGRADGFLGLQCTGAICSDTSGNILFGTVDHLIR
ncbi:MAG: two-component regulator propeller domain-containing protein, partial [Flavobacteriales bacterium]